MVAPGFRSRIATGLLVAAVVLPVPIGAASAAAADRRATPVDRPPQLARPGDQPEDYAQEEAGPGGDDFDGYGSDDYAADPRAGDGRGAGGRRGHHGHSGHPGAPGHLPELPPRFPGLPDAVPGFPHGPSHHHFGGLRGPGRWYHRPHHPFDPSFIGPDASRYPFPGRDDDVYHPRPGHHGPSAGASSPDADRAHPGLAGAPRHRSTTSPRRPHPMRETGPRHGRPPRTASRPLTGSSSTRTRRCRRSRPLPSRRRRRALHRTARMANRPRRRVPMPWKPRAHRSSGSFRWAPALL